jgi:hypothetical protein
MKTKKILSSIFLISLICGLFIFKFYSQTTNIINDSNIVESNEEDANLSMTYSKKIGRRNAPDTATYRDIEFAGKMVSNNTGLSKYNSKPGIKPFPNTASVKSYDSEKVTYEFTVSMISQAKYEYKTISYNLYDYTSDTKGTLLTSGYIKQGIGTIELEPSVAYVTEKTYIEVSIDEIAERHLVTFLNGDQEISKQYYYEEQPIIYPSSNIYKQADDEYEYTFAGWDSNQKVGGTSDLVINAVFNTTPILVKYNNISLNLYSWTNEANWDHKFTNGIEVSINKEKVKAKGDEVEFTLSLTDEAKGFYDSLSVEISYEEDDYTYTLDTYDAEEGTTTLSIPYCDYDVVINVSAHFNKNDSHVFEVGNMYNLSNNSHYDTAPGLTFTSDKWAVKAGDSVTVTMTIADEYKAVYKDVMYYFDGQYGHFEQGENTFTIPSDYSSPIISVDPRIEREGLYTYKNLGLDMEDSFFVNVYEDADKKDSTPYANISFELGSILALADIKSLKIYEAGTNKEVEVIKNGDVYSYVMPACDIVFDVEFDTKEIEIEYDLDGGECEGLPTSITYHKKSENYMVPREVPYKEGYDFDSWYVYNQSNGFDSYFSAWGQDDEIVIYDANYKFNTWLSYMIDKNTTKIKMTALWSDAECSITINYNQEGLEAETVKVGYKNSLANVLSSYIDKANLYCLNNNINAIFTNWSTSETDNVLLEQETMKYSDLSIYAFYEKRDYTVTYLVDGVVFKTETNRKGDVIVLPENPTKKSNNTYSYVFTGWDNETSIVDNDLVFNALFDENYINYTVTFVVEGNVYDIKNDYHYGDQIILPLNPTKLEDNTYTYEFACWDNLVENVNGNHTFEAVFNNIYKDYTVKFISNGNVLSSKTYHYNDEVVYPNNPESYKSEDLKYEYTFNKWDNNITNVENNVVINALFNEQLIDYTVTFDVDGNITSNIYHMGDDIIFPTNPTKASKKVYNYEFIGWDNPETKVTGDMNFKALFDKTFINYTVTFVVDGNEYDVKTTYHYGDRIIKPENPSKSDDDMYGYTFEGWDNETEVVEDNVTFNAIFKPKLLKRNVKWYDEDGTLLKSEDVTIGEVPTFDSIPQKSGNKKFTYEFAGWNKKITPVKEDASYVATYNSIRNKITVSFYDEDNNLIKSVDYQIGDDAPELDYQDYITKSYKEFNGWVTEDGISLNEKLSSDDLESEIKAVPTITITVTSLVIPISITSISLILILIIVLIAYIKIRRRSCYIKKELEK